MKSMFNEDTYKLVLEILRSDIDPQAKTEIVKFFTLPRNTPVRPLLELPDEEQKKQLGGVKRKTAQEIYDEEHPEEKAEKDATKKTLEGRI